MGLAAALTLKKKRISDIIVRCLCRERYDQCVYYLDDFCVLGHSVEECNATQRALLSNLRMLAFLVILKKLMSAKQITKFRV